MPLPRRRLWSARTWVWLGIVTLVALRTFTAAPADGQRDFTVTPLQAGRCEVKRVLSGDTLVVTQPHLSDAVTLRLLSTQAISAEENPALAAEAKRFAEAFVARGEVTLRLDNHRLDSAGRYLAYVECGGEQLNEGLLAAGLARFYYFPGNSPSFDRRLQDAQASAQAAKLGIWR